MLETLRALLEFVRQFVWPIYIVASPNKAVRYTFGRPVALRRPFAVAGPILEPDWYFAFPLFQEIRQTNCAEDTLDIANLPLTLWDGESVTVSYNLRYRIADVLKYQTQVQDAGMSLHAEASCEVSLRTRRREWKRVYRSQGKLARRICQTLTKRVAEWGVEVLSGEMTVCTRAKPLAWIKVE